MKSILEGTHVIYAFPCQFSIIFEAEFFSILMPIFDVQNFLDNIAYFLEIFDACLFLNRRQIILLIFLIF